MALLIEPVQGFQSSNLQAFSHFFTADLINYLRKAPTNHVAAIHEQATWLMEQYEPETVWYCLAHEVARRIEDEVQSGPLPQYVLQASAHNEADRRAQEQAEKDRRVMEDHERTTFVD